MGQIAFTIIFVAFISAVFLTWFFIHRSKEEERRLLIEKDIDLAQLPERGTFNLKFPWLKFGCVITGGSVGVIIGILLGQMGLPSDIIPVGMFLFGGIGMIIAHFVDKTNDKS